MSFKSYRCNRPSRQPSILSRKRKAESELELPSPSDFSSPTISMVPSSCDNTPSTCSDTDNDDRLSCRANISDTAFSEFKGLDHYDDTYKADLSSAFSEFRGLAAIMRPFSHLCQRKSPFPELDWANEKELWSTMVLKDNVYPRDYKMLERHPELIPRMRAILLDWLTEVCEEFRMRRETYYLAQDYVDRYLLTKPSLPRNCLQLLGATALLVAAKMEEIYPPKLEQIAFVTDGACTESDILAQELVLVMALNWNLSPVTINGWLNVYMQLLYSKKDEKIIGPKTYPKNMFVQISQVLDLCILDVECLKFKYSQLAASAVAHFTSKEDALHVSGLNWDELLPCVTWLKPFVQVAFENGGADLKHFSDVSADEWHNIQTHSASLKLLDQVHENQKRILQELSPSTCIRQLTPPLSTKKMKSQSTTIV